MEVNRLNDASQSRISAPASELESSLRAKVTDNPQDFRANYDLAAFLADEGKTEEAVGFASRAVALNPESFEANFLLGSKLKDLERHEQAHPPLTKAVALKPHHVVALFNLAYVSREVDREVEALELYKRAIAEAPTVGGLHVNVGSIYENMGMHAEALYHHERAVELDPKLAQARHNLSMSRLRHGDMARGWADFEYRRQVPSRASFAGNMTCPEWTGDSLAGRSILLTAEQGAGDTIQFVRYARLLKERGAAKVHALVSTNMVDLVASADGIDQSFTTCDAKNYDCWSMMMSLPYRFGTVLSTVPVNVPYLHPAAERVALWQGRLSGVAPQRPRVGLVWAGNPEHGRDEYRSIALSKLHGMLQVPGISWFSLQKGAQQSQLAGIPGNVYVHGLGDYLTNFAETAAVISNLDLVIAVDTSVAHLAGALGKPVWILLANNGDWRWLIDRTDSPWYPSARLFRQTTLGQWDDVAERLTEALSVWSGADKKKG